MPTKPTFIAHVEGSKATLLATHIDAAQPNADILTRGGYSYPVAIALAAAIKAGVPCVTALHTMGFSASDATAISAAIVARGAH